MVILEASQLEKIALSSSNDKRRRTVWRLLFLSSSLPCQWTCCNPAEYHSWLANLGLGQADQQLIPYYVSCPKSADWLQSSWQGQQVRNCAMGMKIPGSSLLTLLSSSGSSSHSFLRKSPSPPPTVYSLQVECSSWAKSWCLSRCQASSWELAELFQSSWQGSRIFQPQFSPPSHSSRIFPIFRTVFSPTLQSCQPDRAVSSTLHSHQHLQNWNYFYLL